MQARSMLMPTGSANFIESSNSLPSQHRVDPLDTAVPLSQSGLWVITFNSIVLSTLGVLIYACIYNRKQHSFRVKLPSKITCARCRYFNNNHFLKCALHPATVMTESAIDCQDYCQQNSGKRVEPQG
jgi:hypothetical protein